MKIKKQYKKLALRYHPDKNIGNEESATQSFKELQASYAVLSDPHERKWYDDHRESILRLGTLQFFHFLGRGGDGTSGSSDAGYTESPLINLWKYFNTGCYSGYDDGLEHSTCSLTQDRQSSKFLQHLWQLIP